MPDFNNLHRDIILKSRNGQPNFKSVIMGDSDSAYITLKHYMDRHGLDTHDDELIIELADKIQTRLEEVLPRIMNPMFNVPVERQSILVPGREIVGRSGLFKPQKKRYAIHVIDDEGFAPSDPKELKIKGIDTQRSDTPKIIQDFLKECMVKVLVDRVSYHELMVYVSKFKEELKKGSPLKFGTPSSVSNIHINSLALQEYEERNMNKPNIHYASMAAINTNKLIDMFEDHEWRPIADGDKVMTLYLKGNNEHGMNVVARPVDEPNVPEWFSSLPFDVDKMLDKMINNKVDRIFYDSIGWKTKNINPNLEETSEVVDL